VKLSRLGRLVGQNVSRARASFAMSSFGIAVGVAAFAFLLALAGGISRVVLGQVFPADRLEVVRPRTSLASPFAFLGAGGPRLDDEVARKLRARPEVRAAYPKMKFAFPARAWGGERMFGKAVQTEIIGDGVDPSLIDRSVTGPFEFRDLETAQGQRCATDDECPRAQYCPTDLGVCQRPVPALISRYLLEIYNGQIAPSYRLPQIGDFLASQFRGFAFNVELGRSFIATAPRGTPVTRRFQLVGISDQAIPIGITVPLPYIQRWNRTYVGDREGADYTSVVLTVRSKRDITPLSAYVKELGFEQANRDAEQAGTAITLVTALFALLATVIISVAAINIAHSFFAAILERRREIGLMRAVGASRADIAALVLAEAGAVGLTGAVIGTLAARGGAALVDLAAARYLPPFPFKPDTFFAFTGVLVGGALTFAVGFALLGALWPALRAAQVDPASTLSAT
jgi:ABC-type antimicrobial peptide transport system permease subunit